MFWKKKSKNSPKNREKIIKNAQSYANEARKELGDVTLNKVRDAIISKESSKLTQAKEKIYNSHPDQIKDHLSYIIREE